MDGALRESLARSSKEGSPVVTDMAKGEMKGIDVLSSGESSSADDRKVSINW